MRLYAMGLARDYYPSYGDLLRFDALGTSDVRVLD